MGEYFHAVCHSCRTIFTPSGAIKLAEIQLSPRSLIELGIWMTEHPGHAIELRGDEYNYLYRNGETTDEYETDTISDDNGALARFDALAAPAPAEPEREVKP
jgi:hypothetical protein